MPMLPRSWDIGPTRPMGPSPWPSWNARSHGHLHEGRPLYIHTPLSAKSDYRIIRSLVKKISKLSPQAIQPRPATYKRSHHPSQTVSLLLATDKATSPGWKEALLSMCFTSLATECQQQRLLRGMTIKYIARPTFGPGLNP